MKWKQKGMPQTCTHAVRTGHQNEWQAGMACQAATTTFLILSLVRVHVAEKRNLILSAHNPSI